MIRQLRRYLGCGIISIGLMTPAIRAENNVSQVILYMICGGIVMVIINKMRDYVHTSESTRIIKVEGDVTEIKKELAAFKQETGQNFEIIVKNQADLTQGQSVLVTGQAALQAQVADVDARVMGVATEVAGVHDIVVSIKKDTTQLQQEILKIEEELREIRARIKETGEKIAAIGTYAARKEDTTKIELGMAKMRGEIETLSQKVATKADIRQIVREEIDRTLIPSASTYKQLSDRESGSLKCIAAPLALQSLKKQASTMEL